MIFLQFLLMKIFKDTEKVKESVASSIRACLFPFTRLEQLYSTFEILIDQALTQKPGKISLLLRRLVLTPQYEQVLSKMVVGFYFSCKMDLIPIHECVERIK